MSGKLLSLLLLFTHLMITTSTINCSSGDKEPTRYAIFILCSQQVFPSRVEGEIKKDEDFDDSEKCSKYSYKSHQILR